MRCSSYGSARKLIIFRATAGVNDSTTGSNKRSRYVMLGMSRVYPGAGKIQYDIPGLLAKIARTIRIGHGATDRQEDDGAIVWQKN